MSEIELTQTRDGGAATLAFGGELDISTVVRAQEALDQIERGSPTTIVLDLSGLTFMDSTGLRFVLAADERAREAGRRLSLIPGPEAVHRVFRMTLLDRRLDFATMAPGEARPGAGEGDPGEPEEGARVD
jgi:anti-sigma B factor antagonist